MVQGRGIGESCRSVGRSHWGREGLVFKRRTGAKMGGRSNTKGYRPQ